MWKVLLALLLLAPAPALAQAVQYNTDVPITCGVATVGGCQRAQPVINPDGSPIGTTRPGSFATGQVAVTTSATPLVAARAGRQRITITSTSAVVYYLGGPTVSASTGLYVAAAAGASVTIETSAALYAVGASAVTLSYMETF